MDGIQVCIYTAFKRFMQNIIFLLLRESPHLRVEFNEINIANLGSQQN